MNVDVSPFIGLSVSEALRSIADGCEEIANETLVSQLSFINDCLDIVDETYTQESLDMAKQIGVYEGVYEALMGVYDTLTLIADRLDSKSV